MKIFLTSIFLLAVLIVKCQVPENIQKRFQQIQTGARFVEWQVERKNYYRVIYTNGFRQSLVFNKTGEIIISESELPPQYVPDAITDFILKNLPRTNCVVWDSFDENNSRSYFVICNDTRKFTFSNDGAFLAESMLVRVKKGNLLSDSSK